MNDIKSMGWGEQTTKKSRMKVVRRSLKRFLEKGFDWIALLFITLIILLTLVFF
ncbi:hypothetical protein [Dyadobacter arcticus]|uniref:Uncharacterized protein n=1 Tax=Dyadobacter arcticus TaxID=1078754 RepID=A0ABX0UEW8_9BACT|nr:hypothetical protein [Dyadobacter arcticus]NIJ51543.1 hypothetical protein [Dyadobacter arcticus]